MHDVGHAPMSHLGEKFYNVEKIKQDIAVVCDSKGIAYDKFYNIGAPHELMSCYIIIKYFYNIIQCNKPSKYGVDFELICRMIVGAKFSDDDQWFKNLAIEVLNSKTIDMDKLDYIIRDPLMTGISVPPIDVSRFFRGLKYLPEYHKVVIEKQAITVVQNIIDTRDCLYLLVCNHHIAVYTDFVFEFYIKHLMLKDDKGENAKTKDKLVARDFFSCDAIGERLVTDNDLMYELKKYYTNVTDTKEISSYTQIITSQIFERKFLTPLWKDLYGFKLFLHEYITDDSVRKDLLVKMCDSEDYIYRRYVAREINRAIIRKHGEVFIVPRSNKFYFMDNKSSEFYIYIDGNLKDISELLPQKKYGELHSGAAFYVYGPQDDIEKVKEEFVKVVKNGLPSKNKIDYPESKPKWLQ